MRLQTIKICENCERNFYGWISSSRRHCCWCESQLTTSGNQIWRCWLCGTLRAWGTGVPEDKRTKLLRCCGIFCPTRNPERVTEHVFANVA